MNPLHCFRPIYQPFFCQRQNNHSKLLKDTIAAIAVSVFALVGAQAFQRHTPGFSAVLCAVPCIAAVIWLLRRCPSSFRHGHYHQPYNPNLAVPTAVVHRPPVYQPMPNYPFTPPTHIFSPPPTFTPMAQPQQMHQLPQTRGGMQPLPPNRFPNVVRVPAYQANQMHPGHRPHAGGGFKLPFGWT